MALTRPRYSQIYDTDYKQSVRLATTADVGNLLAGGGNITNTVDGKTVVDNDRILVKNQNDGKQNGIYRVVTAGTGSNGTWIRALDADASDKVTSGMTTTVTDGDNNINKTFKLGTQDPITLGVTALTFVDPFQITASAGGANTYVQFNDVNQIGGSAGFTFNKTTNAVSISGNVSAAYFLGDGSQLTGIDATAIKNTTNSFVMTHANGNVTVKGNLVPSANLVYDLGSPTQRWRSGYFSGNTIYIGSESISVDTSGMWTFSSAGGQVNLGGTSTFNPPGDVSIGGNLIVAGEVYLAGNTTTISTNNVVLNDSLIYLADGNPTDFLDIGFIGNFTRSALYSHTGFARDATDGVWKLFEGVEAEPTTTIDFGSASYATALVGNIVTRGNITTGGNVRLGRALLTSGGDGGSPGQYLTSTGTGISWTTIDLTSISSGSTEVTANPNSVNIVVSSSSIADFTSDGLVLSSGRLTFGTSGQIKIGANAGITSQGTYTVAVGTDAGNTSQLFGAVAVGYGAGRTNQGATAVAIGTDAGRDNQGDDSVAIGVESGGGGQGTSAVAIGVLAASSSQGDNSVAIGVYAGTTNQGNNAVALGSRAGYQNQHDNSIVLNATGSILNSPAASSFTVQPVRTTTSTSNLLAYSNSTGEVTYSNITATSGGAITVNSGNNVTAVINGGTAGVGNIGASGQGFNTVFAKATSAQYADLAEIYTSDRDYVPGTVLIFGGEKEVTISTDSHDPRVAGVVSTNPAYIMNSDCDGVAVALQGRVPTKVKGPVNKGDRLVTSDLQGAAERLDMSKYQPGCIIGKALESISTDDIQYIEVVIGRF